MNKSKKIILISLLPLFLTLAFLLNMLIPSIMKMAKAREELVSERQTYNQTRQQIATLKNDNSIFLAVEELKDKLSDFDIKVPENDESAVLLIDLDKFAAAQGIKIMSIVAKPETPDEIIDPAKKKAEEEAAKNGVKVKKAEILPVSLTEIPVEITVLGYYSDILKFINSLEKYQRQIVINGITATYFPKDKDKPSPHVEMIIECKIYKLIKQEVIPDETK